jgi:protein-S-isoprenylcysteine O-methyltransferase Ste14
MQTPSKASQKVALNKYGYNAIARLLFQSIFTSAALFVSAGTLSWTWAWVYSVVSLIGWLVLSLILAVQNPGLLNRRGDRAKNLNTEGKKWDWVFLILYFIMLFVVPIVAGQDFRNGWSAETSPVIHLLGIALLVIGFIPLTGAMAANKFFEAVVQITPQTGHQVISDGPYRFVRHPGYVGVILHFLSMPIALGTWAAMLPALVGVLIFIVRTAMEDHALRQELPGYAEFAEQTRYRLLPGIW